MIVPELRKVSDQQEKGFEHLGYKDLQLRQSELLEANG